MNFPIYICDFEDSFTFNIFSELKNMNLDCEVIPYKNILSFFKNIEKSKEKIKIILGPGPGHPKDYQHLIPNLKNIIENPFLYTLGICLGHQLIWYTLGANISRSENPVHGQQVRYLLNENWQKKLGLKNLVVQRYNSLFVKKDEVFNFEIFCSGNEIIMSDRYNIRTYQFHPESVGTFFPERFFNILR